MGIKPLSFQPVSFFVVLLFIPLIAVGAADPAMPEETSDLDKRAGAFSTSIRTNSPLYIPSADSPRESLAKFRELTQGVGDVFREGSFYGDVNWEQEQKLIDLYGKLEFLIDTSELPKDDAYARNNIIISQISEVLDRVYLPPSEYIPDSEDVKQGNLKFWRIPNTAISFSRLEEGPREGDWVFSSDTVEKADKFYRSANDIPYREDASVGVIGKEGGILDHYINYTGPLIPADFTDKIPGPLRVRFFGDPLWKYLASLLILAILSLAFFVIKLLTRSGGSDEKNGTLFYIRQMILPAAMTILLPLTAHLITIDVRLRLMPLEIMDDVLWGLFYLTSFWLCVCVGNMVSAIIIASPRISPFSLDASLVRLISRLAAYFIGFWIIFEGLQDLGLSLVPLIAGVSVSGLAIALAAKPTIGNIIGGILIFADKPFKIGERVVVNGHDGVIEDIGLRSTRIRTLDGHLVTVPNEEIANNLIENIARRPYIKRTLNVTLTYDTHPDKIARAMQIIQGLLSTAEDGGKNPEELGRPTNDRVNMEDFPPRIYFNDLNADSLNILVIYWFAPPDYFDYLVHCTWFNSELLRRFSDEGIEFAFPTQTIDFRQHKETPAGDERSPSNASPSSPSNASPIVVEPAKGPEKLKSEEAQIEAFVEENREEIKEQESETTQAEAEVEDEAKGGK
ncbi:MAG: mechanosensitive ion channel family protein [Verrucomicrobiota bacterium]